MADCLLVGIAGGSGSGKTTFCHQLRASIGSEFVATLHHDSYYRDLSHLDFDERRMTNFDNPEALQTELLVRHATQLRGVRRNLSIRPGFTKRPWPTQSQTQHAGLPVLRVW